MILEALWRGWACIKRGVAAAYQRLVDLDREWTRGSKLVVFVVGLGFVVVMAAGWLALVLLREAPYIGGAVLAVILAVVALSLRDLRADAAFMDLNDWDDRPPVE